MPFRFHFSIHTGETGKFLLSFCVHHRQDWSLPSSPQFWYQLLTQPSPRLILIRKISRGKWQSHFEQEAVKGGHSGVTRRTLNCRAQSRFDNWMEMLPSLVTLWTVACQAPLTIGFFRHKHWSGLPCPSPEDFPDPGIEPPSPVSSAL